MAATIIQRTISGSPEKAIQLNNAQFGRLVTLPVGWNKIRVGIRQHFTNNGGVSIGATPRLFIGIGAGTTNKVGDPTTTHFVGAVTTAAIWTWNATLFTGVTWSPAKRVGSTLTTGANSLTSGVPNRADTNTADRGPILVDITKGSPNYTVSVLGITVGPQDFSSDYFYGQMMNASPTFAQCGMGAAQTIAVNEAVDGTLNAVQISWDHADSLIEICDVAISILS